MPYLIASEHQLVVLEEVVAVLIYIDGETAVERMFGQFVVV